MFDVKVYSIAPDGARTLIQGWYDREWSIRKAHLDYCTVVPEGYTVAIVNRLGRTVYTVPGRCRTTFVTVPTNLV